MKKTAIVFALLALACTDEPGARRILEDQGYTDVELTGFSWFSCSEDDQIRTGFYAKSQSGRVIRGTVCCGLILKDCTVRVSR